MTLAAGGLIEALAELLRVPPELLENVLWGSLLGGLAIASLHLLTMLVTRWGDRGPTSKSLIFSLLVHVSCTLGLVAMPPPAPLPEAGSPEHEERIAIRELIVAAEEEVQPDVAGNTPIWETLPDTRELELARLDRMPLSTEPLESPRTRPEPLTPPELEFPDPPLAPDQPAAQPDPERFADPGLRAEAAMPLKLDDPTAEARDEVSQPAVLPSRRLLDRSGQRPMSDQREPSRGAVEAIAEPSNVASAVPYAETPAEPNAALKPGDDDTAQRLRGPVPAMVSVDDPGAAGEKTTSDAESGSSDPSRFTRLRSRSAVRNDAPGVQRSQPKQEPLAPDAKRDVVVASRDGAQRNLPTDDLAPNAVRPNFDTLRTRTRTSIPPTYRLRSLERRSDVARKYGGTDASERAVESSLRWLAEHQNPEGFWDADGFVDHCPRGDRCAGAAARVLVDEQGVDRQDAGIHADAGVTALCVLAFLGAGYTHEEGQYADQIDRALSWLVRNQREDGFLGGNATHYARMYCHAMATYVLAEAYGMQTDTTTDTRLREPLARALAYILESQNPSDGGWRYVKGQRSDMSMFGWQLMALKSAEIAGFPMPTETRDGMIQFLRARSLGPHNGLATYRITTPPLPPTPSMTAEALFCKQMLGIRRDNPASVEGTEYLLQQLPKRSAKNLYYWYYGTLAMYQYGGSGWRQWNDALRDTLIDEQRKTGHAAGSWDPNGPWDAYGGRLYSTALSTLCLEVYYRFLPLYQIGGQYE